MDTGYTSNRTIQKLQTGASFPSSSGPVTSATGFRWFDVRQQLVDSRLVAEHRCSAGKPCECGGACKTRQSQHMGQSTKSWTTTGPDLQLLKRLASRSAHVLRQEALDLTRNTQPSSASVGTVTFPDGSNLQFSSLVSNDRSIAFQAVDVASEIDVLRLQFDLHQDLGGWKAHNSPPESPIIPANSSLSAITLYLVGLVVAQKLLSKKYDALHTQASTTQPLTITKAPLCVNHDLVCSPPVDAWDPFPWTSDKKHVRIYLVGIGTFDTDIEDCCIQHDVDIWCAHHLTAIDAADEAVIGCVLARIRDRAIQILWDRITDENIFSAAFDLFYTLPALILELTALYDVFYPLASILYFLYWHFSNAFPGLGLMDTTVTNFDNSHDDSCLCGGDKPTTHCSEPCRNLCTELGRVQNCYQCNWKCQYKDGVPLKQKLFDRGPLDPSGNPQQECCPGTDEFAETPKGYIAQCQKFIDDQTSPCPTCENCDWFCDKNADGIWFWTHQPIFSGLPCCSEPDPSQVCCDWTCLQDEYTGEYHRAPGKYVFDELMQQYYFEQQPEDGYFCGPVQTPIPCPPG